MGMKGGDEVCFPWPSSVRATVFSYGKDYDILCNAGQVNRLIIANEEVPFFWIYNRPFRQSKKETGESGLFW